MTTVPDIWILAEQRHGRLLDVAFELLARGRELADRRRARLTAVLFSAGLPEAELQRRLLARWARYGKTPAAARAWIDGNDLPNIRRVVAGSRAADLVVGWDES